MCKMTKETDEQVEELVGGEFEGVEDNEDLILDTESFNSNSCGGEKIEEIED